MVDKKNGAGCTNKFISSVQTNAFPGTVLKADIGDNIVSQDINVLAMVKGNERYVFLFDDDSRADTLRLLGRYASNPDLSFTWHDAAILSQRIRQEAPVSDPVNEKRFDLPLPLDQDDLL